MTAPAIVDTDARAPEAPSLSGVSLDFLDTQHAVYRKNVASWKREEQRLAGGDAVLSELTQFDGESTASFLARQKKATYVNFPKVNATTVTGRLRMHAPTPGKGLDYGRLGEVRTRDKIDTPTFAELVHYNVDGTGNDGSEMPVFFDAVDVRAQATGHRWLFWEAPERTGNGSVSLAQVQQGFRPYVVEWSPIAVPNWYIRNGQLQFAIVRVETNEPFANGIASDRNNGYYLLVREGYTGFGEAFAGGGWWLFNADKQPLRSGQWSPQLRGQVPLWIHYGDTGTGTSDWPAISQSSTMELGQIAVSLMDTISARDYDAWDAASSKLYFLGADPTVMAAVGAQVQARAMMIAVPPAPSTTGDQKTEHIVSIYDSSAGAVSSNVFSTIIEGKFNEAAQQSFLQATSVPDSSGLSKDMGDRQSKSPMLARRAALRQASENTFLYFGELRFGFASPTGFSQWPTDFELRPLLDDIERALDRLRRTQLRSATLEVDLTMKGLEEDGLVTDDNREVIASELTASAKAAADLVAMDMRLLGGGVPEIPVATVAAPADGATATASREAPVPVAAVIEDGTPPVTEPLNGAQITAAKDVMLSLRASDPALRLAPEGAVELLVLVGVARDVAERMVAASTTGIELAPDVEEEVADDGGEDDETTSGDGETPPPPRRAAPPARTPAPSPDVTALSAKLDSLTAAVQALVARPEPVAPPAPQAAPTTTVIQIPESGQRAPIRLTVRKNGDGSSTIESTPESE